MLHADFSNYLQAAALCAVAAGGYFTGRRNRIDAVYARTVTNQGETISAMSEQIDLMKVQLEEMKRRNADAAIGRKALDKRAEQLSALNVALQTTNQELQRANHRLAATNREQAEHIRRLEARVAQLEAERVPR